VFFLKAGDSVVEDKVFAKEVVELSLEYSGRLDESVSRAKDICSEAEFLACRRAIGDVMGETWDQLLMPIFAAHPELKPKDLQ
jgi:hypothetical protein